MHWAQTVVPRSRKVRKLRAEPVRLLRLNCDVLGARELLDATTGGGRGIRTLDTVSRIHAFQACAFSHSATPPRRQIGARRRNIRRGHTLARQARRRPIPPRPQPFSQRALPREPFSQRALRREPFSQRALRREPFSQRALPREPFSRRAVGAPSRASRAVGAAAAQPAISVPNRRRSVPLQAAARPPRIFRLPRPGASGAPQRLDRAAEVGEPLCAA